MITLANRKSETRSIVKCIRNKKHIDTYGNRGIGKSIFLYFICNKISCYNYDIIDIKLTKIKNLIDLLKIIAIKIDEKFSLDSFFFEFNNYLYTHTKHDITVAIVLFNHSLTSLIESKYTVLLLDNSENVEKNVWFEFEEKILRSHLKEGEEILQSKLRIITAGQWRMQWNFFRMREQVEPYQLTLLDRKSTKEMVSLLATARKTDFGEEKIETIIDDIYSLTLGHPKSIKFIIEHWEELQSDNERYQKGIAMLLNEYILPEFIDHAKGIVEDEHYPSSESLLSFLQHLAPLRFISSKVLRKTLRHLSSFSSFYSKQRTFFFDKLLRTLRDENILDKNENREQHEFPAIVRHILLENLRLRDYGTLIRIYQEIGSIYQKMLPESVVDRHAIFIEQLYHVVSWQQVDNTNGKGTHDIEETLRNEISNYFREYGEDSTSLRNLLEADDYFEKMIKWKKFFNSLKKIN